MMAVYQRVFVPGELQMDLRFIAELFGYQNGAMQLMRAGGSIQQMFRTDTQCHLISG